MADDATRRTFGAWLRARDGRDDAIGELAQLVARRDWPETDDADTIGWRLVGVRASGHLFAALVAAKHEWQRRRRTRHRAACPWCAFEAGAATRDTADRTLVEHLKAKHRVRYAFWLAGVLDAEGHIRSDAIDADGMVHLPAVWHGRRDWQ
jgi:hypothetical protein